ncbi:hypothetical protein [Leucobacter luti]|nr:hypothetical protein [Leucobacter luti]MCW2289028.1 ABC-type lipoprotein export system ATPase subunit [Leucobacter luti]
MNDAISELSVSGGIVLIATHDETTAAACSRVVDLSEAQPWTLPG